MAKCIVIGGGLAGISSAIHLQRDGNQVELIEASPKLGGRAYSFLDKKTNTEIDNGQHILMGAYKATLELLEIVDAAEIPEYQKRLFVNFRNRERVEFALKAPSIFYPLNLLFALFNYGALSFLEKYYLVILFVKIFFGKSSKLNEKKVTTWLKENKQSDNTITALWEMIGVGALNTNLNEASAELFHNILFRMFWKGNKSSTIVLPKVPLNKLFIEPVISFFQNYDIKYSVSEGVEKLELSGNIVTKIITEKKEITDFDQIVLAIPSFSLGQIESNKEIISNTIKEMETTSILTLHFWYEEQLFEEKFIGLINSKIQWIFKNKDHYSVVISASDYLNNTNNDEIAKMILNELSEYFGYFDHKKVTQQKVIKEKRATLKSNLKNEKLRKGIKSTIKNLQFAGDWTNTSLPGTIEGAILSGKYAAKRIYMLKK